MKLVERAVAPSPVRADSLRIAVTLEMERGGGSHRVWFDVPADCRDEISRSGNPWLLLMLPIAIAAGEPVMLSEPVDAHLAENLRGVMAIWQAWFPELAPVAIEAPLSAAPGGGTRRASFFSGGVDSFFTLLRHDEAAEGCGSGAVDDLLFIGGWDIPIDSAAELDQTEQRLGTVALRHGKRLLRIGTNLKRLDTFYKRRWILAHGFALATVAHLLEGRYGEVVIASTHSYKRLLPIGSHPLTDPLLGSRGLRVVHDGAAFDRVAKLGRIAASAADLDALRVCWEARRHDNCSRCPKCIFTMAALDALGLAGRTACFDWRDYSARAVAALVLDSDSQAQQARDVVLAARRNRRAELADAMQQAVERYERVGRAVALTRRLPLLWRFEYQIETLLRRRPPRSHAVVQAGHGHG